MKAAHTPGPWNAVNNDAGTALEIWDDDGQMIANVQPQDPPAVEHANAALIAAAPDLLAALREFTDVWDSGRSFASIDVDDIEAMRRRARAAIAKAEGRS